jgi:hypothetical protein
MDNGQQKNPLASLSPNKPVSSTKMTTGQDAEKARAYASAENGSELNKQMLQNKLGGGDK